MKWQIPPLCGECAAPPHVHQHVPQYGAHQHVPQYGAHARDLMHDQTGKSAQGTLVISATLH